MANQGVDYKITVSKVGSGATEAVNDFNAVAAAAAKTNAAMVVNTTAMTTAAAATKTATSTFKAMQGTVTLLGMTAFPQLTLAATTASAAFTGIRTAAAAAGVGMMAVAGPLAVIAAGAYKAYEALKALYDLMGARAAERESAAALAESNEIQASAVLNMVRQKTEAGKLSLSDAENDQLAEMLANNQFRQARKLIQGKLPMGEFMTDGEKQQEVGDRFKDFNRINANARAYAVANIPEMATDVDRQKQLAIYDYNEQYALLNQMREDGLLTEKEMADFTMEADTRRMEALNQLSGRLTEMQQIMKESVDMFAGGFAHAFVQFASGVKSAKDAFREFAQSFLSSVAEMIMKQVVLNMISGIAKGFGGAGSMFAAHGGMFPQMMAAGGVAGVSSVSSPTYFPRFNVVAGEAGREMLTVLARPRMMEVGGMQAVVGSAQGRQLAITSAGDLARGGAGGMVDIRVTLGPELRAEIVNTSVQGARVQVAQDMRQDTPISRGVKGLTG